MIKEEIGPARGTCEPKPGNTAVAAARRQGEVMDTRVLRRILNESLLVTALAVVLAAGSYLLRPGVLPLMPAAPASTPDAAEDSLFKEISLERAQQLFANQEALFADARPMIAYEAGHIRGAVHLDPNNFDQWADQFLNGTPPDQTIITYCEGVRCTLSHELAEKLTWLGFEHVYYLVDGWGQWKAHQLPTE